MNDPVPLSVGVAMQIAQMALVLLAAPLFVGWTRKVKARFQRRVGPALLQPYRDLRRLIAKEVVLAENASWLFCTAPYLIFAFSWIGATLVPTFAIGLPFSGTGDLIALIGLLGASRFLLALAGLDVGTAFGGIGASREMMIAAIAEPAMLMIVVTLALVAGSTQLSAIADVMASPAVGLRVSLALALFAFMIVALAENGRIPVDNPATHLELTMVHEAMTLEYSGRHLAMIELAAWLKLVLTISTILSIFVPFGIARSADVVDCIRGLLVYAGKLAGAGALLAGFEMTVAKLRVFRVPGLLGIALMLGLLGTLLLYVSRSL